MDIASGAPGPQAKAMPKNRRPKIGLMADSDENGRRIARTLLFRVFGGESPRLWALLSHMEAERDPV
jgi:hypothetical protein